MDVTLRVFVGSRAGEEFHLGGGRELVFGRGSEAEIQISDGRLSRLHLKVSNIGDRVALADLDSLNGTLLNGARVRRAVLKDGDIITLGATELRVAVTETSGPVGESVVDLTSEATGREQRVRVSRRFDPSSPGLHLLAPDVTVEQLRESHQKLSVLYQVGTLVTQEGTLDDLYQVILDGVMATLDPDRALILVTDPGTGSFRAVASRFAPWSERGAMIALSMAVLRECTTTGCSVLASDGANDDPSGEFQDPGGLSIRSVVAVPIEANGVLFGAVYADTLARTNRFTEPNLELLAAIGTRAGAALRRSRLVEDMENLFYGSVRSLVAAIDAKDEYTHGHSERVMQYALQIGRKMGLDAAELRTIRIAALFHDIGKIGIRESLLNKPGKLDEAEYALIMEHPVIGARILSSIAGIQNMNDVIRAVRHHHERWDGSGFPDRLAGVEIPLAARIIAVCDAYDAMTSTRAYRKPVGLDLVLEEWRQYAGIQWDPSVVLAAQSVMMEARTGAGHTQDFETIFA